MKRFLLAPLCVLAIGCAGNSSTSFGPSSRFPGEYNATYVSTTDATDFGTGTWRIRPDGTIEGRDVDGTDGTVYITGGRIDAVGNVQATSVPHGGTPVPMNGNLQFNPAGQLTGDLVYQDTPAITYRYTLTRVE